MIKYKVEIRLESILCKAYHGLYEEERVLGNLYQIDLAVSINTGMQESERIKDIHQSIDYTLLYQIVKEEMSIPRSLLEEVAQNIVSKIKALNTTAEIEIEVKKKNPPFGGRCSASSVYYSTAP